jgi:hypothetical protein
MFGAHKKAASLLIFLLLGDARCFYAVSNMKSRAALHVGKKCNRLSLATRNQNSKTLMLSMVADPSLGQHTIDSTLAAASENVATSLQNVPGMLMAAESTLSPTNSDIWVFVAGIIPFLWATIEFWRRIAVGEPFGTGSDSVIIGEDSNPSSSRGRRVLGKDALVAAYILFGIAAATLTVVLYTVITSEPPPADFGADASGLE